MLKFFIVTVGTTGDVNPFVGLGIALKARGHDVQILANEIYKNLIVAEGLGFIQSATKEEYQKVILNPKVWDRKKGVGVLYKSHILPTLSRTYELIADSCKSNAPPILISTSISFAARIAHEKFGVPLATVNLQPFGFFSRYETANPGGAIGAIQKYIGPRLRQVCYDSMFTKFDHFLSTVNDFRVTLGLQPVRNLFRDWRHSPQLAIGLWPDWFASTQRDWPPNTYTTGFVDYDGISTNELKTDHTWEKAVADLGKPIVFTAGTGMQHADEFFDIAAKACHALNRPGLLLTQYNSQIPKKLPGNVQALSYAPFNKLLPQCDAVVHHGGIGTTARALAAGVPQVVVPWAFDQFDNATRIERLGVGRKINATQLTPGRLTSALDWLFRDAYVTKKCAHWKNNLTKSSALSTTCDLLEKHLVGK